MKYSRSKRALKVSVFVFRAARTKGHEFHLTAKKLTNRSPHGQSARTHGPNPRKYDGDGVLSTRIYTWV